MNLIVNQEQLQQQQPISNIVPTFAQIDDSKSTNHLELNESHNDEIQLDQLENEIANFLGNTNDKQGTAVNDKNHLEGGEYEQNGYQSPANDTISCEEPSAMVEV